MFCKNCGCANSDSATFCSQCGATLASMEYSSQNNRTTAPITKKEYFANHCSENAQKNRRTIKILSIVSLTVQGILNLLFIICLMVLKNAVDHNPLYKGDTSVMFAPIILSLTFFGFSLLFTICGTKMNSTGCFISATLFAFIATMFGGTIFELGLRWLVGLVVVAAYIVITMLNHQNNQEYKVYLNKI